MHAYIRKIHTCTHKNIITGCYIDQHITHLRVAYNHTSCLQTNWIITIIRTGLLHTNTHIHYKYTCVDIRIKENPILP